MNKYELMYIVRPTVEADGVKKIMTELNAIFTNNGSKIVECKELGLKDLAYEIEKHRKGYYVWTLVEANNEALNEFNRVILLNEDVIRHIVVKDGE